MDKHVRLDLLGGGKKKNEDANIVFRCVRVIWMRFLGIEKKKKKVGGGRESATEVAKP